MNTTPQPTSRPEKIARFAAWLIALVFASMLNYLGSLVIRDLFYLPGGGQPSLERFETEAGVPPLQAQLDALTRSRQTAQQARDQAATEAARAQQRYQDEKAAFDNWVATRSVTQQSRQDAEVVARTRALDALLKESRRLQTIVNQRDDALSVLDRQRAPIEADAQAKRERALKAWGEANRQHELRVFGVRLAVILPILLLAVWLFIRHRHHRYWPFVYGFGLFALFSFFVELAPYLPSFGGYVRAVVGILLTMGAGVWLMRWLQAYLERKRAEQARNQQERQRSIAYDRAIIAYRKHLCPACEREYRMAGEGTNFCAHCGLCLFRPCGSCGHRHFAFFPFCPACGATNAPPPSAQPSSATTSLS